VRPIDKKLNKDGKIGFWDLKTLKPEEFRSGTWTRIRSGKNLTMAFIISPLVIPVGLIIKIQTFSEKRRE